MLKYLFKKPKPSSSNYKFKLYHSFEKRFSETLKLKEKHPNSVPVIIEKSDNSDVPDIDETKFISPSDLTIGQFLIILRKKIKIYQMQALFLFVNNETVPSTKQTLGELYNKYKDVDGFLYITYAAENTFG